MKDARTLIAVLRELKDDPRHEGETDVAVSKVLLFAAIRYLSDLLDEQAAQEALLTRLGVLLDGVTLAFKGEPEPNTAHSWHDLPELAERVMRDRRALHDDSLVAQVKREHEQMERPTLNFYLGYVLGLIDRHTGALQ